jgi:phosphomannomutase
VSFRDLRSALLDAPVELKFGTSGRRGRLAALTQLEIYTNVLGELRYLQSLGPGEGGIAPGDGFYIAHDLRPSSTAWQDGRGEIAQAVDQAVRDAGMRPVHCGAIPTPALACFAWARGKGSIMVTGSHIPFDWNGYKLNTAGGELLKHHEAPINEQVARVRGELYAQSAADSLFDERGMFRSGHRDLPPALPDARRFYADRYAAFFAGRSLAGMRIILYQHSAVGRDLLREILEGFGAAVVPAGRSETFVPIDTENIDAQALAAIQSLADGVPGIDAVVSTDGDSDRPLILGIDPGTRAVRFFPGDLVGMIAAEFLDADAVVVPVSCNDAIDRGRLARVLRPKTRIGSPYVIAGMDEARRLGRRAVCGWEANGGFLLGSDIERDGHTLAALPTRDAVLPILAVLFAARERSLTLPALFAELPPRYTHSTLIREFPRSRGLELVARFSPEDLGLSDVRQIDRTDGVRVTLGDGDVIHLRPSGNADEFRIYACASTPQRAAEITAMGADRLRRAEILK